MPRKSVEMSAAWRLRFQRDLTNETLAIARGYAEKLVAGYHQAEGIFDLRAPHDLVNQAVLDTLAGIRTWNPDREPPTGGLPLYRHLCRVVYSRAYHDRQRRKRQRSCSFHEVDIDAEESIDNVVENQMSLARDDARRYADNEVMLAEVKAKLYTAARDATDDDEVKLYLGFLESGLKEGEMRREAGWDENAFNRIKRRYETVIKSLPVSLLRDAREALAQWPVRTIKGKGGYKSAGGYRSAVALGEDLRKPRGTEIGAISRAEQRRRKKLQKLGQAVETSEHEDEYEDDDAPICGDDEDYEDEPAPTDGDADAEEERDDN